MSLNNILEKYGLGESVGIKTTQPQKQKILKVDSFKRSVDYKERSISSESRNLAKSINEVIEHKIGDRNIKPSAEAIVPMKVITTLNAASLLKKGYTLKGVDEKQMKMIIQEDDSKSFLRRYSD